MTDRHTEKKPSPSFFPSLLLGFVLCVLPWVAYAAAFSLTESEISATLLFFLFAAGQLAVLIGIDLRNRICRGRSTPTRCLPTALGYLSGALAALAVIYPVLVVWGNFLLPFFTKESMLPGLVFVIMLLAWIPSLGADALWVALSSLIHGLCANHHKKHTLPGASASQDAAKEQS